MMLTLIRKPMSEIVTLEEAKNYLRVDHNFDDDLIKGLIKSTRQAMESIIQKSIMKQTWEYTFTDAAIAEFWGKDRPNVCGDILQIPLPMPPILNINGVVANSRVIDPERYVVENFGNKYCLCVTDAKLVSGKKISITINYDAGISDQVENIPYQLKLANLMLLANAYQERFSYKQDRIISKGVKQLLSSYLSLRII